MSAAHREAHAGVASRHPAAGDDDPKGDPVNTSDTTVHNSSLDELEIDEAALDLVLGGLRNRATSSKVIDVSVGWTGTDADF